VRPETFSFEKEAAMQTILLWALVLFPPIRSDEPKPQSPKDQYEALLKKYDAPLGEYLNDQPKAKSATEPFLKLARENPDDPVAVDALHWVVTHTLFTPMAGEAMDILARSHIQDLRLKPVIRDLDRLYGGVFEPMETFLRAVLEKSRQREVRGWACLALGRYLATRKERVLQMRYMHLLYLEGARVPIVYTPPKETDEDLGKMTEEAEALFTRVIEEFVDIDDIGSAARKDLFALLHLARGQIAPEIKGEDVDGKPFKLSDYRGKVVVLDFWNHEGCAACRAMYPKLRSLVERMKDKPFVLLGINSDDERPVLNDLRDKGEITWRFWCDGPYTEGPIVQQWNIRGFPTTYVLDAKGVIRHKGVTGEELERAVESLLKEVDGS
jgi:peroxiredoxin